MSQDHLLFYHFYSYFQMGSPELRVVEPSTKVNLVDQIGMLGREKLAQVFQVLTRETKRQGGGYPREHFRMFTAAKNDTP